VKRQYHTVHRADDKSASIIQQFCQSNGQILLPLVEKIESASQMVSQLSESHSKPGGRTVRITTCVREKKVLNGKNRKLPLTYCHFRCLPGIQNSCPGQQ